MTESSERDFVDHIGCFVKTAQKSFFVPDPKKFMEERRKKFRLDTLRPTYGGGLEDDIVLNEDRMISNRVRNYVQVLFLKVGRSTALMTSFIDQEKKMFTSLEVYDL